MSQDWLPPSEEPEDYYQGFPPPPDDEEFPPPYDDGYIPPREYEKFSHSGQAKPQKNVRTRPEGEQALVDRVLDTLRLVLASTQGMSNETARELIIRVAGSAKVLSVLNPKQREIYEGVFEVLSHECSVVEGGTLDLSLLPIASEYSDRVRSELFAINERSKDVRGEPHSLWTALTEAVQRHTARTAAVKLVKAIDNKLNTNELMEYYKHLEPPTAQKSVTRQHSAKTAREIIAEHRAATAGRAPMRFSTGLPTLDVGYTAKGELRGFLAPGQVFMVMGPTGTGKSSFSYAITPAMTQDLLNYGMPDAKHVLFHTEEETIDKIDACRMLPGQPYHHLSDMMVFDAVGTSRTRIAMTLYDLVVKADLQARETKRPITDFLPYIVQLDYLQSISEQGETEVVATGMTSEFLLRGVAAWNPEEMAKFSNVSFREYTGMNWPSGMEHHRVAVLAYAQLVKVDGDSESYRAGKSKIADFVKLKDDGTPAWDLEEGDLRLFTKGMMRGSGVLANNAHGIIILHRSKPNTPVDKSKTEPNGIEHLGDTRARILFDKARGGTRIAYAPMEFDRQVDGPKAQYFDTLAENAILAGRFGEYDTRFYTGRGSPILPVRPQVNPLSAFRY